MRRIAFLTYLPTAHADTAIGPLYAALGSLTYEGRLVDAVREAPARDGLIYVCTETGHAFSRIGRDCDHLGTIFNLLHMHQVAHGYIRHRTLSLVIRAQTEVRAFNALIGGGGIAVKDASDAITCRAPFTIDRAACVRAILEGLPTFERPDEFAFRQIHIHPAKVLG